MKGVSYVNPRTGSRFPADEALWRAPDDGGPLELEPGTGIRRGDIDAEVRSLWRYGAAIRVPVEARTSLGEGWTPLLPGSWHGIAVRFKAEQLMPTGSFKDRGTAVMLAHLRGLGVREILEDSSGNAGSSIATYAAAAGLDCTIMVPASAPAAKRIQMAAVGAGVKAIEGTRQDVAAAALEAAEHTFYASHNWQPFFIEGTRTLAFEIWEQSGFRAPDHVVVPLGYGSNVIGLHLGFGELLRAGEIEHMPRIHAVQALNCAPVLLAWDEVADDVAAIEPAPTLADGIACSMPVRGRALLKALRESGGSVVGVTEKEIVEALMHLAHMGHFVEPTSATAGAALSQLMEEGTIGRGDDTVVVLTGSGLKAVDRIGQMLAGG